MRVATLARVWPPSNSHRLSCNLVNFELVQILMRVDKSLCYVRGNIQSTLSATLVLVWLGHESWENSHANSTLIILVWSEASPTVTTRLDILIIFEKQFIMISGSLMDTWRIHSPSPSILQDLFSIIIYPRRKKNLWFWFHILKKLGSVGRK